jgi:SAM-dependent methyltransferase
MSSSSLIYFKYSNLLKRKIVIGKFLSSSLWEFVFSYSFLRSKKYLNRKSLKVLKFDVWEESDVERYKIRKLTPLIEKIFKPVSITYIDIDPQLIKIAKKLLPKKNRIFVNANICCMPFKNESFDVVVDFSTTAHLNDKEFSKALKEISRVLKHKGLYLLYHINKEYFNIEEYNKLYTQDLIPSYPKKLEDVLWKLQQQNFEILEHFYFFPFLYDTCFRWVYFLNRHKNIFLYLPKRIKFRFFDNPRLNLFFYILARKL